MAIDKLEPPPSVVELVTSAYDVESEKTVDKSKADSIWKKWLSNLHASVNLLLEKRSSHVSIENANFGKGTTAPTQVIIGNYNGWEFTISDDAVMTVELPHDVDADETVSIHLSFVINEIYATNNGEVQFQVDYSIVPNSGGESITSPSSSGTIKSGDIDIHDIVYDVCHDAVFDIPVADYENGDIIGVKLSRIAITDGNNPTAHPVVLSMHFEYASKRVNWYVSD